MMKRLVTTAVLAFAVLLGSSALAAQHTYSRAGVSVWTPGDWMVKNSAVLRATPKDKSGFVAFEMTKHARLGEAAGALSKIVAKYVGRASFPQPRAARVGTRDAIFTGGSGMMDGMTITFEAYLYQVGGKVMLGIALAPKHVYGRHKAVMSKVLRSVK